MPTGQESTALKQFAMPSKVWGCRAKQLYSGDLLIGFRCYGGDEVKLIVPDCIADHLGAVFGEMTAKRLVGADRNRTRNKDSSMNS